MEKNEIRISLSPKLNNSYNKFHEWIIEVNTYHNNDGLIRGFFKSSRMKWNRGTPPLNAKEARELGTALLYLADVVDPPKQARIPTNDD